MWRPVNVIVMVFITGVFLLLQTNTIRSTAKGGTRQGEAQVTQADGEKKKRKVKLVRNLKVISPVYRKAIFSSVEPRDWKQTAKCRSGP